MNLRAYLKELRTPTKYRGYLGTLNQLGHMAIGAAFAAVYLAAGLSGLDAIGAAVVAVPLLYLGVWEANRRTAIGQTADALTDAAFVALGGLLAVTLGLLWVLPALVAAALFGAWTTR